MASQLSALNEQLHINNNYITLKSLEVNKKFKIKSFSKCSTAYGEKVFVNLGESKTTYITAKIFNQVYE
jgi:hypothetical protein